jgi:hypothetical protein
MNLSLFMAARELRERFGIQAVHLAVEAGLQAHHEGDALEGETWFDIAEAVEELLIADER